MCLLLQTQDGTYDEDADAATKCVKCAIGHEVGPDASTCVLCTVGMADEDQDSSTPCTQPGGTLHSSVQV